MILKMMLRKPSLLILVIIQVIKMFVEIKKHSLWTRILSSVAFDFETDNEEVVDCRDYGKEISKPIT